LEECCFTVKIEAIISPLLFLILRYVPHFIIKLKLWTYFTRRGGSIAQAVSRWLPTVAARVRAQVKSCRICGRLSGIEAGFLRVLWFSLPILIPLTAPQSSSTIILGWYNRPISVRCTEWTQSHPTTRNSHVRQVCTLQLGALPMRREGILKLRYNFNFHHSGPSY
jgi:hypothetical protein